MLINAFQLLNGANLVSDAADEVTDSSLKITLLGTRGEIEETAPYHRKQSGILINDDLLLDLGEKSFLRLQPQWILLTHLHPDHAYFIRKGHLEVPETTAQIFAPEKPSDPRIAAKIHLLTKKKKLNGYTVIPIPTHHSKHVKSQGYLIKKGSLSILYTADLVWINKEYQPLYQEVDLIITEASFIRKGGMVRKDPETGALFGHNGIPNLIQLFKKATQTILFVHFGSWFYQDIRLSRQKIRLLGKEHQVHTLIGYDGMQLELKKAKERR